MNAGLFEGELVRLVPIDIEKDVDIIAQWDSDSEYLRQLDDMPATRYPASMVKEWQENNLEGSSGFIIRTRDENKVIGFVDLSGFEWTARNAWVGIGIGDAEYRGKGFGTEAMKLVLDYAFRAIDLHRVNLSVFGFNKRAVRSYEKCGFKYEGTLREAIYKEDQRWDMIEMGILREDWEMMQRLDQYDTINE